MVFFAWNAQWWYWLMIPPPTPPCSLYNFLCWTDPPLPPFSMLFESFFLSFFSPPHPELSCGWMLYNNHCVHASSSMQAGLLSLPICACRPTVISQLLSCLCVQRLPPVRSLCQNRVPPPLTLPSPLYCEWLKVTETLWRNPECIAAFRALFWGVFLPTHSHHTFPFCAFVF